jgi:RimJ/RimL family protein N-acetyltransferase
VFDDLDLLRVEMTTIPDHPAVPALAAKLGFAQGGVLRARNVERGRRVDIIWFGLLRDEWAT